MKLGKTQAESIARSYYRDLRAAGFRHRRATMTAGEVMNSLPATRGILNPADVQYACDAERHIRRQQRRGRCMSLLQGFVTSGLF